MGKFSVKRLAVIPVVVVALFGAGCDALNDDLAAIVEGIGITVDQVEALTVDQSAQSALGIEQSGTLPGDPSRQALSTLVAYALVADELERRGVPFDPNEEQNIRAQLAQNPEFASLSEETQELVAIGQTRFATIDRVLSQIDPTDEAELRDLYERTPSARERLCLQALFVPTAEIGPIDAVLDEGATVADVIQGGEFQVEGLLECVTNAQLGQLPPDVASVIRDAEVGTTERVEVSVPAGDFVVIVFVDEVREVGPDDPLLQASLEQIIQGGLTAWLQLMAVDAEIDIDPRFGSGYDAATLSVIPPETPLQQTPLDPLTLTP